MRTNTDLAMERNAAMREVERLKGVIASMETRRKYDLLTATVTDPTAPFRARIAELDKVLQFIKDTVCGDKNPNWTDDWSTTHTRGLIADLCDSALNGTPKPHIIQAQADQNVIQARKT